MTHKKKPRSEESQSTGAGDSQLELSPPNTGQSQPPAESMVAPAAETSPAAAEAAAAEPQPDFEAELEGLRRDLKDASERHLRLAAEFDNYRKRVERERMESWGRAQGDLAVRLLDVLDDLERVAHHSETAAAQTLLDGVQLVEKKLRTVLTAAGLEQIDAENATFDPNSMEAVAMAPAESPEDDDVVSDVFQRGYRFKGQLLRPARVRVKKHH